MRDNAEKKGPPDRLEGCCLKRKHANQSWSERYVVLDRWHLTYYKTSKPPAKGATPSKRFALSSLQAPEFSTATPEGLRSVTLATRNDSYRFSLQFPPDLDMALWREHLENWITRVDTEVLVGGETLRAHELRPKIFFVPSTCDVCGGMLVGSGLKCEGPCGLRTHVGEGVNGHGACSAELRGMACECGILNRKHRKVSDYQFGDVSRALARRSVAEISSQVKAGTIQANREWDQKWGGLFADLERWAVWARDDWNDDALVARGTRCVANAAAIAAALGFAAVLVPQRRVPDGDALRLGALLAAWNVVLTLVFAAALSKFARRATRYALARSEMWQQFLLGEVQLDLDDLHISLPGVLASVRRVVERMFTRTCAAAGVALLLWARLLA